MAKLTRDCDPPERMLRALLVLEGLAMSVEDGELLKPGTPAKQFVDEVYMIAHAATGACCKSSLPWLDLVDECMKVLKVRRIVDVDKIVQLVADGELPRKHNPNGLLAALGEAHAKDH